MPAKRSASAAMSRRSDKLPAITMAVALTTITATPARRTRALRRVIWRAPLASAAIGRSATSPPRKGSPRPSAARGAGSRCRRALLREVLGQVLEYGGSLHGCRPTTFFAGIRCAGSHGSLGRRRRGATRGASEWRLEPTNGVSPTLRRPWSRRRERRLVQTMRTAGSSSPTPPKPATPSGAKQSRRRPRGSPIGFGERDSACGRVARDRFGIAGRRCDTSTQCIWSVRAVGVTDSWRSGRIGRSVCSAGAPVVSSCGRIGGAC